jgi:hypothetical protein
LKVFARILMLPSHPPVLDASEIECLDGGIRGKVAILVKNGVETIESCQGDQGHQPPLWPDLVSPQGAFCLSS